MNVSAKKDLLKLAEVCIQLDEQGFKEELSQINIAVRGGAFLESYFWGSVSIGVAHLNLDLSVKGDNDKHKLSLPLFFGEDNLPSIVDEYRKKVTDLIQRVPQIKEQRKLDRIAKLERELELELV